VGRRDHPPPQRRFPPPWSVEEQDARFVVRDHNGQALSYRSRIYLLLTFGRDGALGTSHEPSVGRYTGYGSGLLYGELQRRLVRKEPSGATAAAGQQFSLISVAFLHEKLLN